MKLQTSIALMLFAFPAFAADEDAPYSARGPHDMTTTTAARLPQCRAAGAGLHFRQSKLKAIALAEQTSVLIVASSCDQTRPALDERR